MGDNVRFEEQLARFLYTKCSTNIFQAGGRYSFSLSTIEKILGSEERTHLVLQHLLAASNSGLADRFSVLSVLAVLLKKATSRSSRDMIYHKFEDLTRSPEDFFLYLDCHTRAKGGWGAGLRRQLKGWYEKQDPLNLLVAVSKIQGQGIWSHADLVRHSKITMKNTEIMVILSYCLRGLAKTKARYGEQADAQMVLGYLDQLNCIRNCTQPTEAVKILTENGFGTDQINSRLLQFPQVWLALLPKMTIRETFKYLKMMTRRGLFSTDSEHFKLLKAKFTDRVQVASSGVQPAEVAQLLANLQAKWALPPGVQARENKSHLQAVTVAITPGLAVSLEVLLQHSLANVREMKKSVTVIVDTRASGLKNGCWRCHHVSMVQAAAVTIATLLAGGCDVRLLVPTTSPGGGQLKQVTVQPSDTVKAVVGKLVASSCNNTFFSLKGISKAVKETGTLLVLSQNQVHCADEDLTSLQDDLNMFRDLWNDFKFVYMQLSDNKGSNLVCKSSAWMLEIIGWNPDSLRVLEAFVTDLF